MPRCALTPASTTPTWLSISMPSGRNDSIRLPQPTSAGVWRSSLTIPSTRHRLSVSVFLAAVPRSVAALPNRGDGPGHRAACRISARPGADPREPHGWTLPRPGFDRPGDALCADRGFARGCGHDPLLQAVRPRGQRGAGPEPGLYPGPADDLWRNPDPAGDCRYRSDHRHGG